MENGRPFSTRMTASFCNKLDAEMHKRSDVVSLHQQIIESLLYLALWTRLNKLPPVSLLAGFQTAATLHCHWAANHIMRYLHGSKLYGNTYNFGKLEISAIVDSEYAGIGKDRKSMTGILIKLGNAVCS